MHKNLMNCFKLFICFSSCLITFLILIKSAFLLNSIKSMPECLKDEPLQLTCTNGSFILPGMKTCHKWLSCEDEVTIVSLISISVVKMVYLAKWKSLDVVVSFLRDQKYSEDFAHNLFMLQTLAGSSYVVKVLGYCQNSIVTKFYKHGTLLNLHNILQNVSLVASNKFRLNLCINYASIVEYLHSSPVGVRVICDSNSLEKTLSQYLLNEDLSFVINDLDATPEVDKISGAGVLCGKRPLTGKFVAPEQLWPYGQEKFSLQLMHQYDEKTDIWKIPDVCNWLLGKDSNVDVLKYKLFSIHKKCKSRDPYDRPNATLVLQNYQSLLKDLG